MMELERRFLALLLLLAFMGCGVRQSPPDGPQPAPVQKEKAGPSKKAARATARKSLPPSRNAEPPEANPAELPGRDAGPLTDPPRPSQDLGPFAAVGLPAVWQPTRKINEAHAAAAGIRSLSGKHLTLYTDLPASPAVDDLPQAFDAAVVQWCHYFGIDPKLCEPWRMHGFLMKEQARFKATGLLPDDLPQFLNGFTRRHEFWMNHQSSEYYQRHLLLHEGTHGFMFTLLEGSSPPWYTEGSAELLGTHHWSEGKITLPYFPASADEVPRLGRIEVVRKDFAAGDRKTLTNVIDYGPRAHLKIEAYGWCWAAAAFLDGHPRYRDRFRSLPKFLHSTSFNEQFVEAFRADWDEMADEWQIYVAGLAYGHDLERTAVDFTPGKPLTTKLKVTVAADRGWQNAGVVLEGGKAYRLQAAGRYQVASEPKIWWCEPGGVSIRYVHGKPLGLLEAVVRPTTPEGDQPSAFLSPAAIGLAAEISPAQTGTLFLRVNDSPGELHDNSGKLQVEIAGR